MIQTVVKQHDEGKLAGKWDIYVYDGSEAGDLLLFSNQGYENREDAERMVGRVLSGRQPDGSIEPVDLLVRRADGTGGHRPLR